MSTITEPQVRETGESTDPFRYGWRYVWQTDSAGVRRHVQVPLKQEDLLHPQEEDFIVQNPAHNADCAYLQSVLQRRTAERTGSVVLHDVRIDWQVPGVKPHGPDVVAFEGVTGEWDRVRGTFLVRDLGARPLLVIEVTSPSTRDYDLDDKVLHYWRAGVPFYAIVDSRPHEGPREIHLIGYRATPDGYLRVELDERGWLWLEAVQLWLAVEGDRVVCYDEQGNRLLDYSELAQVAQDAEARAEEAATLTEEAVRARKDAEAQAAQAALAKQQAEEAAAQAARAQQQAEANAKGLALRLQEMEAELRRLRGEA
jgi:hypothetical protein